MQEVNKASHSHVKNNKSVEKDQNESGLEKQKQIFGMMLLMFNRHANRWWYNCSIKTNFTDFLVSPVVGKILIT